MRFFLVGSRHGITFEFPDTTPQNVVTVKDAISDLPSLCNGANFYSLDYKTDAGSKYAKLLRGISKYSLCNHVTRNSDLVIERYP
jgi:DNA (cytosine-5)-methyltransferase 1